MAVASKLRAPPKPFASNVAGQRIQTSTRTSGLAREQLEALLMPAAKAYLLGYVMDILPAILKALLKFVTTELKRIRKSEKRLLKSVESPKKRPASTQTRSTSRHQAHLA